MRVSLKGQIKLVNRTPIEKLAGDANEVAPLVRTGFSGF